KIYFQGLILDNNSVRIYLEFFNCKFTCIFNKNTLNMSHTPMKKSVFERIERGGGNSSPSSTANTSHKSTHGFCNIYIKDGTCPLGDTCKYIHEQPNLDKQQGSKGELRITKVY
ncbi:unnamed protein product, partial [Rotaria socialis]